jgi:ribosomal protein S18 acetylase RimI-like enzyme
MRIRSILMTDPIWAAYALADLQPAFELYCRWLAAESSEGLVLLFSGLEPTVLMSVGTPEAVGSALTQASKAGELPERVYLSVRDEHLPVIERFYDASVDRRPMLRMALRPGAELSVGDPAPKRLTPEDVDRLQRLYAHGGAFAPDAFDPYQLTDGVFFGIAGEDGELLAAGGTHILNAAEHVAAIGNIYTRPDARGRGYARGVTGAIVNTLQAQRITNVVLNVDDRNVRARRLYERLGFSVHCSFWEGVASQ